MLQKMHQNIICNKIKTENKLDFGGKVLKESFFQRKWNAILQEGQKFRE